MTILYKPVLIKSAEQAAALPVGSVSPPSHPDDNPAVKITETLWVSVWDVDDDHDLTYGVASNSYMFNDLVLVPIEAEEQHIAPDAITYSRYVTAWEEA